MGNCENIEYYKNRIIDMVSEIGSEDYIFKIYHYILAKYRREKGKETGRV